MKQVLDKIRYQNKVENWRKTTSKYKDCCQNIKVVLNLEKEVFKPYRKPGDKPVYVNAASNHPPRVLRNIPLGINRRLCDISCNEEVFQEAMPVYQEELRKCGYSDKLVWMGDTPNK